MPGWEIDPRAKQGQDVVEPASKPDQTGVDFEQLKRKYLSGADAKPKASDDVADPNVPSAAPEKGDVEFVRVKEKTATDQPIGPKTVIVSGRGIIGKQG